MENNNKVKTLAIIFAVVLIGVGLFDLGFTYIYREALKSGSCELCFELNPDLRECENYRPVNLLDPDINLTFVSYGK